MEQKRYFKKKENAIKYCKFQNNHRFRPNYEVIIVLSGKNRGKYFVGSYEEYIRIEY